ncbi:MAG: AAA family ATPase, partial [Chthoniobacteraceae bacterium]|nr:AAA family ATPase [Chthoniobacteraceae bacterium]
MRILRIQFENLNSLPSGDIDLEHGPLAEAGIFAITGPTGAGKSTLLDALTLALYGRAARYDKEPNPENMMSRHTGSCRAEVLFEVPRGRYQARWELRRARGRADGKVQPARRSIVEDATGAVLAQKIDEADRLVEELTGLDFERFRRSVLLAQGEFTRFLKAKPDERAELLESLTGTAIYSELSILAFREAARREEELAARREALGRVVLLSEEGRAAAAANIARLTAELETRERSRAALAEQLAAGLQLRDRLREEIALATAKTALEAENRQAAPALERLRTHRQTGPFLAPLETLDALERRAASGVLETGEAETAATRAREQLAAGLHAAQAIVRREQEQAEETITRAEAKLRELGEALARAEAAETAAAAEASHTAATLAERQKDRTEAAIAAEFTRLEQKRNALFELRLAMERRDAAAAEASRLADEEAGLDGEIETARQEKAATLQEAEAQAVLLEDARASLARQERIASMAEQRADLQEGHPCPLCGALDHPFARDLPSSPIEEARRHLHAAKMANDTAAREARIAAEGLTRMEERLAGVQKRRGEIRWEQTADHEAFEKAARSVRIFTVEGLEEAFADLARERAAHETLAREIREAQERHHAAEKGLLTCQGKTAQLREKRAAAETARAVAQRQREALCREAERVHAAAPAEGAVPPADSRLAQRLAAEWGTLDAAFRALEPLRRAATETEATAGERRKTLEGVRKAVQQQAQTVLHQLEGTPFADIKALRAARLDAAEARRIETLETELAARGQELEGRFHHVRGQIRALR